jgi:hypothetical protein
MFVSTYISSSSLEETKIYTDSTNNKTNSGALVRQRTIPTERPPLVGEVSANFSG